MLSFFFFSMSLCDDVGSGVAAASGFQPEQEATQGGGQRPESQGKQPEPALSLDI